MLAKNLKSIHMRFGEKVHDLMSDYLHLVKEKKDNPENIEKIKTNLIAEMDQEFNLSKKKEYAEYDHTLKFWLTEHYYGHNIDELYKTGQTKLLENFDNFLTSSIHDDIKKHFEDPKNTFFIEPKIKDFDSMKIQIDNIPELMWVDVYAQPDFGIVTNDKKYIIYDRKSGKTPSKSNDSISDQLKVYAYKVLQKIGIEKINDFDAKWFEVYLKDISLFGGQILEKDLQEIEQRIVDDVKIQKEFLLEKDVEKNEPIVSDNFTRTTDLQKCSNCTFFKVCEELKKFENKDNTNNSKLIEEKFEQIYDEDDFPF